uniref:FTP domain-containing protein n=1 Tax=Macrostomum lignano TaxID=282301 RepID=A0A1I8FWB0_9PLAT
TVFSSARLHSDLAPVATETALGSSRLKCSEGCSLRPFCFGFSWLRGLCRFFNVSAFYNEAAWNSTEPCHVYTMKFTKLNFVTCNQSTVAQGGVCERAFDGNKNQNWWGGLGCILTQVGVPGWWEAELATAARISHVTIVNRLDCCSSRHNKMSLRVDDVECCRMNLAVTFSTANFSCNAFGSRFGMYNLQSHELSLCEVEIFGQ